jgi:hypothetical protein
MEIVLVIIGVGIFIRVWLSQLGLHKQADEHHKELVDKIDSLHNVSERDSKEAFSKGYRRCSFESSLNDPNTTYEGNTPMDFEQWYKSKQSK